MPPLPSIYLADRNSELNTRSSELRVSLLGDVPKISWIHDNEQQDLSELLDCLGGRRFNAVGNASYADSCVFSDVVFGDAPALELRNGDLHVLNPEHRHVYIDTVMTWLMLRESSLVSVHAAVCAVGEIGLVLLGPSRAGKSTLACALAAQGADYYGDESAYFDKRDGRLYVHVRSPALRPGGRKLLATPPAGDWYEAKPGDPKFAASVPVSERPCPSDQSILFFLDGFGEAALTPIPGGEATVRLARVLGHGNPTVSVQLDTAADLVSRFPCHRLTVGPPDATAKMLIAFVSAVTVAADRQTCGAPCSYDGSPRRTETDPSSNR